MAEEPEKRKRKRSPVNEVFIEHSKILPQAVDLEEVILGALMLEAESKDCKKAIMIIKPEFFYKEAHQVVFKAIFSLKEKDHPIDILTVVEELRSTGELDLVGGPYYIGCLINRISSSKHILFHSYIIHRKYIQRELINIFSSGTKDGYEDTVDPLDQIEDVTEKLNDLRINRFTKVTEDALSVAEKFEEAILHKDGPQSAIYFTYKTGHDRLDSIASWGFAKIFLVGGEAKHGKTKFVSEVLFKLLENHGENIGIKWFSLEDPSSDILAGYCSSKVFVSAEDLKGRNFDIGLRPVIKDHLKEFKEYDVDFYDNSVSIKEAMSQFELFSSGADKQGKNREDKLCICVIDNLLSLTDKDRFENNIAGLTDYVLGKVLECKQRTKGMFIVLHHFKVDHMRKDNLATGYRPTLLSLKGSDAVKRVPNVVLLVNYPTMHKDLTSQYHEDARDNLERLFIVDAAASRGTGNKDSKALIHMFCNLDYNVFKEIKLLPKTVNKDKEIEKEHTPFDPKDPVPF
ncbi:MAG: hypothetical protein H8E51_07100 [Bacteroidetes bacterium]|nr:hypothetical protein [Bacteroidota bacterium]